VISQLFVPFCLYSIVTIAIYRDNRQSHAPLDACRSLQKWLQCRPTAGQGQMQAALDCCLMNMHNT